MRRKNIILIGLTTTFLSLLSLCFTSTITVNANPITDADVVEVHENTTYTELVVSYILEDKPELTFKTSEADVINLTALEAELGVNKVKMNSEKTEVTVTLDKPDSIDFKLQISNKKVFKLEALDTEKNVLFYQTFNDSNNTDIMTRADSEPKDLEESSWIPTDKLRISEGPILNHKNGSTTKPILYFGDYINAAEGQTIATAYSPRGAARQNSLTAANFGVIYAENGSRIEDGPMAPKNHVYTSHYGDNQSLDSGLDPLNIEDRPFGSVNSFISNNLYNSVVNSDEWKKPGTSGPDKNGYSFAMAGRPSLYYRKNPETGFEEQRLVYLQKAHPVEKNGRENRKVTTTVKLSFNSAGKVVTNITFLNSGDRVFYNFSGFSNHDLSLNKDGREVEKPTTYNDNTTRFTAKEKEKNKRDLRKIGNYVPMRSLGNKRGMYIESKDKEVRTSFYTNHPTGPSAWAARSIGKSYLATKGFMNAGLASERYYPWKSGKPKPIFLEQNHFYNKGTNRFKSPFVPQYKFNAFDNQRDFGDKNTSYALRAGARLGATEDEPMWDAGFTMRTAPIDLKAGESIELEYATQMDINSNTAVPVIEMDHQGIPAEPELIPQNQETFSVKGSWYDFDSPNVSMRYSIDNEEFQNSTLLFDDKQSPSEMGKIHDFVSLKSIPLEGLDRKKSHTIRFQMNDWENDQAGNFSRIKETVIKFVRTPTEKPQINVTTPDFSIDKPYNPFDHKIDMSGVWFDKDSSKIKSITYTLEDGVEKSVETDLNNSKLGEMNRWFVKNVDIEKYNDFKKHKIAFKIIDDKDNVGKEIFYFQHIPGSIHLTAPKTIEFGKITPSFYSKEKLKPEIKEGQLSLFDFREKGSKSLDISLSVHKFYRSDGSDDDNEALNDSNSGDDSDSTNDPDTREASNGVMIKRPSLRHFVYWKGKRVNSKNLIVGQNIEHDNQLWEQETDLTDELVKNLEINFRTSLNGSEPGKYVSQWTWQTVDSIPE